MYIALGIIAGLFSGAFGVGGGLILVPCFVLFLGLDQKTAQGTSLAIMLPPITFLAVWRYYNHGHLKAAIAAFVCLGFLIGSLIAAEMVQSLPNHWLRRSFAVILVAAAVRMFFVKS